MPRIAFATCTPLPEPDPDEELLLEACRRAGLDVHVAAWNDFNVDWGNFELLILRSTWNYYEDPEAFESWVTDVSECCRLWNPADLVLDNMDKRYLAKMSQAGVPVVPTWFVMEEPLETILEQTGWENFVVKPTVSAGSFMTCLFHESDLPEADRFLDKLEETHEAMVQKFMPSVYGEGEASLIYIDGELSHSVVKQARFLDGEESVSEAKVPSPPQIEIAKKALATIKQPWLYARVDLMADEQGRWLLSELELIEPSLFFKQHPPALDKFVVKVQKLALG